MNNIQDPYNHQPIGQMMPQQQHRIQMRQRMTTGVGRMQDAYPRWLMQYPIVVYILALGIVSLMYSAHSLPWYYMLSGVVGILAFFYYGETVAKETAILRVRKEKTFEKRIFITALIPRIIVVALLQTLFSSIYGDAFGFENADAVYYDEFGKDFASAIRNGEFRTMINRSSKYIDISDMGYSIYLGFIYWMTNDSVIVVRVLKCIWSSLTVLLIYRLAKRNFGEQTGRIAAIFCALWPNFWYYCSAHLKETEMVFLGALFIEQADQMLRSRQFTAWKVAPVLLIAAALFTVRTPLALVALLALIFSVVMSSSKVVNWGKRIIVGGLAIALIGVVAGNQIEEQSRSLLQQVQGGQQRGNMEWRAERKDGNAFAKYAGASVFAPMIFTLPFPSMVRPFEGQEVQQMLNGGNFVKNILSAFTILALVTLLMSGQWREHLLPLSFMLGYLVVLVFSTFAQAERFHQPAMPFEFMFAAYGLSVAVTQKKFKRWFTYWCVFLFVACVAWNWFKMAGRGL